MHTLTHTDRERHLIKSCCGSAIFLSFFVVKRGKTEQFLHVMTVSIPEELQHVEVTQYFCVKKCVLAERMAAEQ